MNILIAGATGFVGRNLVPMLLDEQFKISILGRDIKKINHLFKHKVKSISWDNLEQIAPEDFDIIINLAGENIAEQRRWTSNLKKKILESRVQATTALVEWCLSSKGKYPRLYNASAIGIYGLQKIQAQLPIPFTEKSILPNPPTDFLSEVGQAWEEAVNKVMRVKSGFKSVNSQKEEELMSMCFMRFGVVLKSHEGLLKKLEKPFSLGLGTILGSGHQAISWIHITDLCRAILFLLKHPYLKGPFNICSPHCVSQKSFAKSLAASMHKPLFFKLPAPIVKMLFGQMGEELLLSGQCVYPQRLLEQKFKFLYPDLKSALEAEYGAHASFSK